MKKGKLIVSRAEEGSSRTKVAKVPATIVQQANIGHNMNLFMFALLAGAVIIKTKKGKTTARHVSQGGRNQARLRISVMSASKVGTVFLMGIIVVLHVQQASIKIKMGQCHVNSVNKDERTIVQAQQIAMTVHLENTARNMNV